MPSNLTTTRKKILYIDGTRVTTLPYSYSMGKVLAWVEENDPNAVLSKVDYYDFEPIVETIDEHTLLINKELELKIEIE